ncbi:unnamed protein product, partial [marine sediment metagenome]
MIDIHTHILPNLDDGAKDIDTAINLLREAEKQGITTVFATPHILTGLYQPTAKKIMKKLNTLQYRLNQEDIDIILIRGAEVGIESDITPEEIMNYTLNGSGKYILI